MSDREIVSAIEDRKHPLTENEVAEQFVLRYVQRLERALAAMTRLNRAYRKAAIMKAVDRFLGWKLPQDFSPDAGISFKPPTNQQSWPVGTNLLTADQAKAMFEHVLAELPSLSGEYLEKLSAYEAWLEDNLTYMKEPLVNARTGEEINGEVRWTIWWNGPDAATFREALALRTTPTEKYD